MDHMMTVEVKTKYTTTRFVDDYDGTDRVLYCTVDFAWGDKADPLALLFSVNMDNFLLAEVRKRLAEKLSLDPKKDIALEDTWLMIQGYSEDDKHFTTELVSIVKAAEAEFDRMMECAHTK